MIHEIKQEINDAEIFILYFTKEEMVGKHNRTFINLLDAHQ